MRKAIGLVCLLVMVAAATPTTAKKLLSLSQGGTLKVQAGIVAAKACTTEYITWNDRPFPSLGFGLWARPEADTWAINVTFHWSAWGSSGPFDLRSDTVITGCSVRGMTDTLRAVQRHWCNEFYPQVSQGGYFIFAATESLTDTVWVDSVVFNGYGE